MHLKLKKMRLTSLSRKLGVTRDEIVNYLKTKNKEVSNGVNVKLSEEEVELVMSHFYPEPEPNKDEVIEVIEKKAFETDNTAKDIPSSEAEEIETNKDSKLPESEKEIVEETSKKKLAKKPKKLVLEKKTENLTEDIPVPNEDESLEEFIARQNVDKIKVKKIKLEGIKVLGKIELPKPPEPKPKEDAIIAGIEKEEPKKQAPKGLYGDFLAKNDRKTNRRPKKVTQRRPLSFTEKQALEQKRLEEKKRKEQKELKRKKKEHYAQKVKPILVQKSPKLKKPKETPINQKEIVAKHESTVAVPKKKSLFSKLWSWLNGEYDKF